MEEAVYSVEWSGDPAIGEAIANILCDELRKRNIQFRVEYSSGMTTGLNLFSDVKDDEADEKYRAVLVPKESLQVATETLDFVLQHRGPELKQHAMEIAKTRRFASSQEDLEEYERHLTESLGW